MKNDQATQTHPILEEAARAVVPDPELGARLDAKAADELRRRLSELPPGPALFEASSSLVAFAAHLHRNLGFEAAGMELLEVATAATSGLRELLRDKSAERSFDELNAKVERLARFSGRESTERRRAPKVDSRAPEGTERASQMFIPRRVRL